MHMKLAAIPQMTTAKLALLVWLECVYFKSFLPNWNRRRRVGTVTDAQKFVVPAIDLGIPLRVIRIVIDNPPVTMFPWSPAAGRCGVIDCCHCGVRRSSHGQVEVIWQIVQRRVVTMSDAHQRWDDIVQVVLADGTAVVAMLQLVSPVVPLPLTKDGDCNSPL